MCTINTMATVFFMPKDWKFPSHIIFFSAVYMATLTHIFSIICMSPHPLHWEYPTHIAFYTHLFCAGYNM